MRSTARQSYWIVLIPILFGAGTCGGSLLVLSGKIKDMPRVRVPGQGSVVLGAGEQTGYLEGKSVIDGQVVAGNPSITCQITARDTGEAVAIAGASGSVSYTFGGYQGESVLSIDVPRDGEYMVDCTGSGVGALAFGTRIGTWIVVAVAGGLVGAGVAIFLWWRIRKRRKDQRAST